VKAAGTESFSCKNSAADMLQFSANSALLTIPTMTNPLCTNYVSLNFYIIHTNISGHISHLTWTESSTSKHANESQSHARCI